MDRLLVWSTKLTMVIRHVTCTFSGKGELTVGDALFINVLL